MDLSVSRKLHPNSRWYFANFILPPALSKFQTEPQMRQSEVLDWEVERFGLIVSNVLSPFVDPWTFWQLRLEETIGVGLAGWRSRLMALLQIPDWPIFWHLSPRKWTWNDDVVVDCWGHNDHYWLFDQGNVKARLFVDSKFRRHAIYICVRYTSFSCSMPSKDSLFWTMLSLGVVKSFRCVENHSKDFIDFPRLRIVKLLMARRWPMPWVNPDLVLWRRGDFWGLAGFTSRRGFTGHGFLVEPNNSTLKVFPARLTKRQQKR